MPKTKIGGKYIRVSLIASQSRVSNLFPLYLPAKYKKSFIVSFLRVIPGIRCYFLRQSRSINGCFRREEKSIEGWALRDRVHIFFVVKINGSLLVDTYLLRLIFDLISRFRQIYSSKKYATSLCSEFLN